MSLFEARDVIAKGSGTDFDPRVVDAFMDAFRRGELEVPAVVV
jgi:HD-GYP domain-containing protein (c-di-GMP phosphodiesterase class II)